MTAERWTLLDFKMSMSVPMVNGIRVPEWFNAADGALVGR